MSYEAAINKSWTELEGLDFKDMRPVKFLADEYEIDPRTRRVASLSCNSPAKDFYAILILHYLIQELKGLPDLTGEWMGFKELSGIEGYGPAFRERSIEPIIRKYGSNPQGLIETLGRLPAKRVDQGDMGIEIEAFKKVPVLVLVWKKDEEFAAEANILFDKSITGIFCTEDIVVLSGLVAGNL